MSVGRILMLLTAALAVALLAGWSLISLDGGPSDSGRGAEMSAPSGDPSHEGRDRIRKKSRDALRDLLREPDPGEGS